MKVTFEGWQRWLEDSRGARKQQWWHWSLRYELTRERGHGSYQGFKRWKLHDTRGGETIFATNLHRLLAEWTALRLEGRW